MSLDDTRQLDLGSSSTAAHDLLGMFRVVFEEAPHGVIVSTEDGTILFANATARRTFAYGPGELVGQRIERVLPHSPKPQSVDREFWTGPDGQEMHSAPRAAGVRRDGVAVPLEVGFHVVSDDSSRYVVTSFGDITDRIDLEAHLAAATNEHLGFQRLVADIAIRLGGVEPPALDQTIIEVLRDVCEALQMDHGILWRRRVGEALASPLHYWVGPPAAPPDPFPIASIPYTLSKLESGEGCWFERMDDIPDPSDRLTFERRGLRSGAVVPLSPSNDEKGETIALAFSSMTREQEWTPAIIERLRLVAGVVSQAMARTASSVLLLRTLDEVSNLRDRLAEDNVQLRREVKTLRTSGVMESESAAIRDTIIQIEQVAPTTATVLLLGETGSGKEVAAQAIHDLSPRHKRPMVRVSCAAIPSALIESELFGRERGAYTGALSRQIGRFEAANQSTLFLDEIGDLPMEVQVKLLRVLQERVIERLGSMQPIKVDVRIIAATNRNLEEAVANKTFREDLYYRLNVFPITVPPLRERVDDIAGLVWTFVDEFSRLFGKTIESVSQESMRELQRYHWPGNVRELRNVIERAVIISTGRQLVVPTPRSAVQTQPQAALTLSELEVEHIRAALESCHWKVRGPGGAADRLGLKPTTLESRMARLGITRKKPQ